MLITTVFMDVDDTLLDFHACAAEAMRLALSEKGHSFSPRMFEVFSRINADFWLQLEKGELTQEELFTRRWNRVFAELGISLDGVAFEGRFRHFIDCTAIPLPGAKQLLTDLNAAGLRCYAATNAPHAQQLQRLEQVGMLSLLTDVFTSELLGLSKPGKAFFEECLNRISYPKPIPEQVLMIGDSFSADIAGAMACGFVTCWYNHRGKSLPPTAKEPDFTVFSLDDITLQLKNRSALTVAPEEKLL